MRESYIEAYLVRRCHEEGFACWKFVRPGQRAAFDRVVPMPHGRVAWVETKRSFEQLSPAQKREQQFLTQLGHVAVCVSSKDEVETFVEEFLYH